MQPGVQLIADRPLGPLTGSEAEPPHPLIMLRAGAPQRVDRAPRRSGAHPASRTGSSATAALRRPEATSV